MSVTIERDGWKIVGDTAADLKAGIEALREVLDLAPPPQPTRQPNTTEQRVERQSVSRTVRAVPELDRLGAASFLEALRNSGRHGLGSDDLRRIFGVSGSRALGAKLEQVERHLSQVGFTEGAYLSRIRTRDGRRYRPAERIEEALQAIMTT